jgi:hypothetical protein
VYAKRNARAFSNRQKGSLGLEATQNPSQNRVISFATGLRNNHHSLRGFRLLRVGEDLRDWGGASRSTAHDGSDSYNRLFNTPIAERVSLAPIAMP